MPSYSIDIVNSVMNGNRFRIGNKLGRFCIKNRISVTYVANELGVTRQTIYNWFQGKYDPQPEYHSSILVFMKNRIID